jgi:hypothetical protein
MHKKLSQLAGCASSGPLKKPCAVILQAAEMVENFVLHGSDLLGLFQPAEGRFL